MTGCTLQFSFFGFVKSNIVRKHAVAAAAVFFRNFPVHFVDPYRFVVIIGSKSIAVIPAINSFYSVFPDGCIRSVAVIARGNRTVRGFLPGIILVIHYMTVVAGCRVIQHIRIPFGVVESGRAQPDNNSYTNR